MSKKRYSHTFLLSFRNKHTETPVGFHPVYIKQKRVQCNTNLNTNTPISSSKTTPTPTPLKQKEKWDNLEKVRAFTNSENSFIKRTRNRTESEILIGNIRSLLNKVTDKTFKTIMEQLAQIQYDKFDESMNQQIVRIFISKSLADRDFGELYAQIGHVFSGCVEKFNKLLTSECVEVFQRLSDSDIATSKCMGLMRVMPYFIKENIIDEDNINTQIIQQCLQNTQSELYIELLCKFCEKIPNINSKCFNSIDIQCITNTLNDLKSNKTIPARVRFMIEDTVDGLKK